MVLRLTKVLVSVWVSSQKNLIYFVIKKKEPNCDEDHTAFGFLEIMTRKNTILQLLNYLMRLKRKSENMCPKLRFLQGADFIEYENGRRIVHQSSEAALINYSCMHLNLDDRTWFFDLGG
jgi:hypothetical protein